MHYNSFTETTKTLLILIKNFKYDYLELVQLIMHIFCMQLLQRYSNGAILERSKLQKQFTKHRGSKN